MKIALFNEKITIQKATVTVDGIGNQKIPGKITIPVLPQSVEKMEQSEMWQVLR